jgi:unsaturated rhamnogalacturonyl hydrolase
MIKTLGMAAAFLLALLPGFTGTDSQDFRNTASDTNARKVIQNLLVRDYMRYGNEGIHYAEACAAVGALRFARKAGDEALLKKIISRYERMLEPGSRLISDQSHVDHNVIGIVPLQIYMLNRDPRYLEAGLRRADLQWENPREDGLTQQTRWWIDDMYMVGMLQMQAYRATGDARYADRAALQIAAYIKKLQQPNGLFFHGPEAPFFWGRGNGWVASALAELLTSLPPDHALRPQVITGYRKMMEALLKHQSENGMWRQLVDYPYAWAESSCTAMFAFSIQTGINHGWLNKKRFAAAADKAWNALCAHVDREGNIREICVGTGQMNDIEFYLKRPRTLGDLHGQAPFLWLAVERMKK